MFYENVMGAQDDMFYEYGGSTF